MTDMIDLEKLDQLLTLQINSFHCRLADQLWYFMSDKTVWIPLYVILVIFLFCRLGWKRALIVLCAVGLTFAACDMTSTMVKNFVERLRPCYNADMVSGGLRMLEGRGGKFGFFSAHAANALGCFVCIYIGLRADKRLKYRLFFVLGLVWAVGVAVSRIFVGKHYLGDVVVGMAVGTVTALVFASVARLIMTRLPDSQAEESA
ncbi:MAG: phosphatase PAP2 family protein [Candidatus Cryptobacteroides sp.]